ncbi:MAG: MFS transporter [Chloroflexi bacterium]|nr:MFS transporter [Chloroflexota bacterium]
MDREPSAADRNFKLGVLNGLLFAVAETLMDPTLVLVAFVTHLSGSALLLGLVVPLRDGSWFLPQLWVSSYLQSWPRKLKLYRYMAALRFAVWSGLVLAVFFVKDPRWLLLMFFVFFGVGAVASGISGLPFLEVVGKTIPPKKLGLFFAWRQALGGLAGIVGSLVVGWMLAAGSPLAFPYNYGVLLGLGVILVAGGLAAFGNVSEPEDTDTRPATSVLSQIRRGAQAFRSDGNFRHFISLRSSLMIAGAATPFFAVYVQQRLGGAPGMVGVYLAVYTVSSLLSNVIYGRFSAQWGNRRTMAVAASAGLAMTCFVLVLAIAAPLLNLSGAVASWWLIPVFALSGLRESGVGVAGQSLLLDISPAAERSLYLGFTNSLLGIVLFATTLSGVVVQSFGFMALLTLTLLAHAFAVTAALRMRDVPHAGQR